MISAWQASTAAALFLSPAGTPLPEQRQLLAWSLAKVRAEGLRLPNFTVRWKSGAHDCCAGAVRVEGDVCTLALSIHRPPHEFVRTCFHECQHLADIRAGYHCTLSHSELEERAERFALTAMEKWWWKQ